MTDSTETRDALVRTVDAGLREAHRLRKFLMSDIARQAGNPRLNPTHYRTLLLLDKTGPCCMKDIRQHLGLEAGSFTPVVDRLIEEGLLERERDNNDRRRILLQITGQGEQTVILIKNAIQEHMVKQLSVLDDRLLNDLASSMETIRQVNEILQEGLNER